MSSRPPSPSTRSSTSLDHEHAHDDRSLTILYATETGTAQDVADRLARLCRCLHIRARVHNTDVYPPTELINEHLVLFVVSTTGSGREPRGMTPLWQMLLRADLPDDLFEDLAFAVFGLGDSSYEKFCWPGKLLSRRLQQLGANELCARGEGDEQHHLGVEGALGPWAEKLSEVLLQLYPLPEGMTRDMLDDLPPPRVSILDGKPGTQLTRKDPLVTDREYHTATLTCNRRTTATDWYQDVRHFEFRLDETVEYEPGDVAVIHPEAMPLDVESFLACIGFANTADDPVKIEHILEDQSLPDHLPTTTTIREIFTRYVDINAVPRRSFFALLKHFTTDEMERDKLEEFLNGEEGADDLYEYCQRPRRTIREVLEEFRSARIPRDYVFDLFPPLRPRQFSIASSIKRHPRSVQLCIAIVQYRTMLKIPRRGVCTTWLAGLQPGYQLRIGFQKGFITVPNDTTPVLCVGPGTGVAPMRAVIQQRVHDGVSGNTLYFGCRSESRDHHYGDEWRALTESGTLVYRAAFSRDGPEGESRTYVQDLIRADAKRIWELVGEREAWVYISGSANKMPAAVRAALAYAIQSEGGRTEEEAKEYVARMEREGRLVEECWS
ncbi:riboflavin synthase domain-like protein [Daedaleopsis nitida]|nr:riboflavin synthase domain-like protein [Daedaleopsis nitida]